MDKDYILKLIYELGDSLVVINKCEVHTNYKFIFNEVSTKLLNTNFETICSNESKLAIIKNYHSVMTFEWKFLCLNLYILKQFSKLNDTNISVKESKLLQIAIYKLCCVGILSKIIKNLPNFIKLSSSSSISKIDNDYKNMIDEEYNYNILSCCLEDFHFFLKNLKTRHLFIKNLHIILTGVHQIISAPLKPEYINKYKANINKFTNILHEIQEYLHPIIFIKSTMLIFQSTTPKWFKRSLSTILNSIICSNSGVQNITLAMFDDIEISNDTGINWKILTITSQIITAAIVSSNNTDNQMIFQIENLLHLSNNNNNNIFEKLVIFCIKSLKNCQELQQKYIDKIIFKRILNVFNQNEEQFDVTEDVCQCIRLIYGLWIDDIGYSFNCLDINILKITIVEILFYIYTIGMQNLNEKNKNEISNNIQLTEIENILQKFIKNLDNLEIFLDIVVFNKNSSFPKNVDIEINKNRLILRKIDVTFKFSNIFNLNYVMKLLQNNDNIQHKIFIYLLKNIKNLKSNTSTNNQTALLQIYEILSQLTDNSKLQNIIFNNPNEIVLYFKDILESDNVEEIYIILMILDNIDYFQHNNSTYKILINSLKDIIRKEQCNIELTDCVNNVLKKIQSSNETIIDSKQSIEKSELDQAFEDVVDVIISNRGHGLINLTKLINKKDENAMKKKHYILNIFQLNLKDNDSFIYLLAINGLSAMASIFPDTVLQVICEEYADISNKKTFVDDIEKIDEIRMKLGQVLVQTTKSLNEMAIKYKSLLLNTFFNTIKDDNDLIRASSLSNLGEICKVLNYKLDTIITEVLLVVHDVLTNDKSIVARRAAVLVTRQLLIGLDTSTLSYLKDEILPIYYTLKSIYLYDNDDIMKLHAQLALEQLNENVKKILFLPPKLHTEKNIIVLK